LRSILLEYFKQHEGPKRCQFACGIMVGFGAA
jgi:hypothetical protein